MEIEVIIALTESEITIDEKASENKDAITKIVFSKSLSQPESWISLFGVP